MKRTYTFCQSPDTDRWHIRRPNSGNTSLCGKPVAWDLSVPLSFNRLALCCADCAARYAVEEDTQ